MLKNFNLRHSSLRNVIKRIFGVVKNRFPILKNASLHLYGTATKIVITCCVLHNFIRNETGVEDQVYEEYDRQPINEFDQDDDDFPSQADYKRVQNKNDLWGVNYEDKLQIKCGKIVANRLMIFKNNNRLSCM